MERQVLTYGQAYGTANAPFAGEEDTLSDEVLLRATHLRLVDDLDIPPDPSLPLTAMYQHLMGGLPIECYQKEHQNSIEESLANAAAQPVIEMDRSSADAVKEFQGHFSRWNAARYFSDLDNTQLYPPETAAKYEQWMLDHHTKKYPGYYLGIVAPGANAYEKTLKDALPHPEWLKEGSQTDFHDYGPQVEGRPYLDLKLSNRELLEERLSFSHLISSKGRNKMQPFSSLRDFVLALLPKNVPLKPAKKSLSVHGIGKIEEQTLLDYLESNDPALVARLTRKFGDRTAVIISQIDSIESVKILDSTQVSHNTLQSDEFVAPREVESTRGRLERLVPGLFVKLAQNPSGGKTLAKELSSIPALEEEDLAEWAQLNRLTAEELTILYEFISQKTPTSLVKLEALVQKLFTNAGQLKPKADGFGMKHVLFWESGADVDPWTKKMLDGVTKQERSQSQALIVQTEDHAASLKPKVLAFLDQKTPMTLGSREFYEFQQLCMDVGQYPDPDVGFAIFKELIEKSPWGDLEGLHSYISMIADAKTNGVEIDRKDPRFVTLLAVEGGLLKSIWQLTSRGIGESGSLTDEVRIGGEIATGLQKLLVSLVGSEGFDPEDKAAETLSADNDLLLVVLTDFQYYLRSPEGIKAAIEGYKKCSGADSSHPLAKDIKGSPVFYYAASKWSYLKGEAQKCCTYVRPITRNENLNDYHTDFLSRIGSIPDAELREDRMGLKGYAPILMAEENFLKELVRIMLLALHRLPPAQRNPEEVKDFLAMLERLKGLFGPAQLISLYLGISATARDERDFPLTELMIERSWEALGDGNGYQARRIHHHEAEAESEKLTQALETGTETPEEREARAAKVLVIERCLSQEERNPGTTDLDLQKIWEYDCSYFQALLRFAKVRTGETTSVPAIPRRNKEPFTFEEFNTRPITEWIMEAQTVALESLRKIFPEAPASARWVAGYIRDWARDLLPTISDPAIQKLPILREWEAVERELNLKKAA